MRRNRCTFFRCGALAVPVATFIFVNTLLFPIARIFFTPIDHLPDKKGVFSSLKENIKTPTQELMKHRQQVQTLMWELMLSKMKETTPVTPVPVAPRHKVSIDGFADLLLPRVCGHHKPHFIAFVSSTPRNFAKRKAQRETWTNKSAYPPGFLEVMFVVGRAPSEDDTLRRQLLSEWQTHGDLLYTDFIDSYGNLTYKTLVMFRFVVEHCAGTPYVIRSDDDTVVNVAALHAHMLRYRPRDMVLDCFWHVLGYPFRQRSSKWHVTYEEVPLKKPDLYPNFCSGGGVASTYVTIKALYSHVPEVPWLRLDDVYATGYLAEKIHPPVQFHHAPLCFGEKEALTILKKPNPPLLLFVLEVQNLKAVWDIIAKLNLKNCSISLDIPKLESHSFLNFRNPRLFNPV